MTYRPDMPAGQVTLLQDHVTLQDAVTVTDRARGLSLSILKQNPSFDSKAPVAIGPATAGQKTWLAGMQIANANANSSSHMSKADQVFMHKPPVSRLSSTPAKT